MRARPRLIGEITLASVVGLAAFVPTRPELVERWFSLGLYPPIQRTTTSLSNLLPLAFLDVLSVSVVAVSAWMLSRTLRNAWQTRQVSRLLATVRGVVGTAGIAYLAFLLMWGFNYRRVPMADRLQLVAAQPTPESVAELGHEATRQMNALHDDAHRAGWPAEPVKDEALRRGFLAAQRALLDAPPAVPGRLKRTLFGPYFRWTGVDGMINPFGLEVLANPDLLPFERPFVAAHEWAHLAGFADEAEANFVGWLACMQGNASTQYSGWLFVYWQVSSELGGRTRTRLAEALDAGPRGDITAIIERLRSGELPWLRTAGWQVYDQYLKANRVEEGIRSYGAVVTLIVRARFEPGWVPVRATSNR